MAAAVKIISVLVYDTKWPILLAFGATGSDRGSSLLAVGATSSDI